MGKRKAIEEPLMQRGQNLNLLFFFSFLQGGNGAKEFEEIEYKREQPLIWREDNSTNGTNEENFSGCRNSIQGKTLLVDDEGYVCPRNNLLQNGCCDSNENIVQYSCDTCNELEGCCAVYEKCVSCCLNPNKVSWWYWRHLKTISAIFSFIVEILNKTIKI